MSWSKYLRFVSDIWYIFEIFLSLKYMILNVILKIERNCPSLISIACRGVLDKLK